MSGRLIYMGTDPAEDVLGWVAVIGSALHFAALDPDGFRKYVEGSGLGKPINPADLHAELVRAHELVSPSCPDPV